MYICALFIETMFLGFSTQNHAESFGNYIKKCFLDPKRTKSDKFG